MISLAFICLSCVSPLRSQVFRLAVASAQQQPQCLLCPGPATTEREQAERGAVAAEVRLPLSNGRLPAL
jgi:hypothetical protein